MGSFGFARPFSQYPSSRFNFRVSIYEFPSSAKRNGERVANFPLILKDIPASFGVLYPQHLTSNSKSSIHNPHFKTFNC